MPFLAALTFLTVFRVPGRDPDAAALEQAGGYFPLVGLLLGALLVVLDSVLRSFLPLSVVSGLILLALLALTGGLHLDGLADTSDAFFAGAATPERRLEIMRDTHVGAYAVAAVVLVLLIQYASLTALSGPGRNAGLLLMAALSRWAMTLALAFFPYARSQGLGSAFTRSRGVARWLPATLLVALVSVLVAGFPGIVILGCAWAAAIGAARLLLSRLPGLTGDTYGAINEVVGSTVLITSVALQR